VKVVGGVDARSAMAATFMPIELSPWAGLIRAGKIEGMVAEVWRGRSEQAGQRIDQGARLVQVTVFWQIVSETQMHGGRAEQMDRGGRYDLDGRHVRDVTAGVADGLMRGPGGLVVGSGTGMGSGGHSCYPVTLTGSSVRCLHRGPRPGGTQAENFPPAMAVQAIGFRSGHSW
jgi:hypothetical protein